ncbi:DNA-processing protein DprA [Sphingomonas sp. HF-S3]|uniref:DNA-processing protein DprA n=1 Tax=Sphingomonas rustica TaxID=3103142 RepID=A0ABV0B3A4_9SPHN
MNLPLAHGSRTSGLGGRTPRYQGPLKVEETSLRAILRETHRGNLEPSQLSLLDRGMKPDAVDGLPIFYAGDLNLLKRPAVSVIGTRNVSEIGRKRAMRIARELVEAGVVVVSGLAEGVDTHALTSALRNGGSVVAVIGTPLDKAYPASNARLQEEIYDRHLLISQFPAGERTFPSSFPARNRTMAALSDASVIIEASESSGTLHQAAECVRLGRWLGISKGVVEDPRLTWPAKFKSYEKCVVLESTEELLHKIYGSAA